MKRSQILFCTGLILTSTFLITACGETIPTSTTSQLSNGQTVAGPGGAGAPGGQRGDQGGLPPNFAEIQADYPELAAALEAMQSLSPEERRTQMDALMQEHPEWAALLMPPGTPPGGQAGPPPGGGPPGGQGGPPPGNTAPPAGVN